MALVVLAILAVVGLAGFFAVGRQRHVFPCAYQGPAIVIFNDPAGQAMSRSATGVYEFVFDQTGVVRIKADEPQEPFMRIQIVKQCQPSRVVDPIRLQEGSVDAPSGFVRWIEYSVEVDDERARELKVEAATRGAGVH